MRTIGILDTSVMSFNYGDQIIMESCRNGLKSVTENAFVINMPTHSPLFHKYEFSLKGRDGFRQSLDRLDLKFVCGTNLLEKDMFKRKNSWNLHILDSRYINDFILVGVGTDGLPKLANYYTRKFYDAILSHKYLHSVRDEKTKLFLENLGFGAINTGCATLWTLTKDHCEKIPHEKSRKVIFTLTDYCRDKIKDKEMIQTLCDEYESVNYWPQGMFDLDYFNTIKGDCTVDLIGPSLEAYNMFLESNDCDYVGTRLHAGIKAMQKGKRSIIIGVDNRAKDMYGTFGINLINRNEINQLEKIINNTLITNVHINEDAIKEFISQFL